MTKEHGSAEGAERGEPLATYYVGCMKYSHLIL